MRAKGYETNLALTQGQHWWHWGRNRVVEAALSKHLTGQVGRILDYGAGLGGMIPLLSQFGEVTAVEPSADARTMARQSGRTLISPSELAPNRQFDLVTAFDVLEHVEDELPWLETLNSHLTPSGTLVLTVPAFPWLWSLNDVVAEHKRRYTKRSLSTVLDDAGFAVTYLTHWNSLLLPGVALVALRDQMRLKNNTKPGDLDFNYLDLPAAPLNHALKSLLRWDSFWIEKGRELPFGVSLLVVARKKPSH